MKTLILSIFTFISILSQTYAAKYCKDIQNKREQKCLISIDKVHPTQFALGMVSIKKKVNKIEKRFKKKQLHDKIIEKVIPVVIGPDQKYYILDGHHSSYALLKAEIPHNKKVLHVSITKDCSTCSDNEFKRTMTQDGFSYLYCPEFIKREFYELPKTLSDLGDNPYRSLSWVLREKGCYNKVNVNYLEFIWAKILKTELELRDMGIKSSKKSEIKKVETLACDIVKSLKYKSYPGHLSKK